MSDKPQSQSRLHRPHAQPPVLVHDITEADLARLSIPELTERFKLMDRNHIMATNEILYGPSTRKKKIGPIRMFLIALTVFLFFFAMMPLIFKGIEAEQDMRQKQVQQLFNKP